MSEVSFVKFRTVLNSKGSKTIECVVRTKTVTARSAAPSGTSAGSHEVVAMPKRTELLVEQANSKLVPKLIGNDVNNQEKFDELLYELDDTVNTSVFGGSVLTSCSLAVLKANALEQQKQVFELFNAKPGRLPVPLGNVFGSGRHSFRGKPGIQEILLIPSEKSVAENVFKNAEVYRLVGERLREEKLFAARGLEGAWAADIDSLKALELVYDVVKSENVKLGLDVAANELFDRQSGEYSYEGKTLSKSEQLDFMLQLVKDFDLRYVEDPFEEEDFDSFAELTGKIKGKVLVCGDDLFTTDYSRLASGVRIGAGNSVLIKPNQVGTVSGTVRTVGLAKKSGFEIIVSHRSGETCDDSIAHLAVGFEARMIKTGIVGGERLAKLNELIRIEDYLSSK